MTASTTTRHSRNARQGSIDRVIRWRQLGETPLGRLTVTTAIAKPELFWVPRKSGWICL